MTKRKQPVKETGKVLGVSGAAVAALLAFAPTAEIKPPKIYPGPYLAHVVKVTDSDTYKVVIHTWPGETKAKAVRIYGVDTPEKFRPKCDREKMKALVATKFVKDRIKPGDLIELSNVFLGKFAGRIVANVTYENFKGEREDISNELIENKFAVPYFGKTKTKDWCAK